MRNARNQDEKKLNMLLGIIKVTLVSPSMFFSFILILVFCGGCFFLFFPRRFSAGDIFQFRAELEIQLLILQLLSGLSDMSQFCSHHLLI